MNEIDPEVIDYITAMAGASRDLVELADRDPLSPTYGCFYYPYWLSKSSDYVNARCQEAVYTLALIYKNSYPGVNCRGSDELRELAISGALLWASLQHSDGSFDEWYAGEHGFAATAFSGFALSETFSLLEEEIPPDKREVLKKALVGAGVWLCNHDDLDKINHEAVGAAALYSLGKTLGESRFRDEAGRKVKLVLDRQTREGWFPELGGVDTGYSFLTLEYLSQCYLFSRDEELKKSLNRALEFLAFFVHPDMTTGREYNLCGNSYVSLLAASIMGEFSPLARSLFSEGIAGGNTMAQLAQDDLSRCYHLYNGLLAYGYYRDNKEIWARDRRELPFKSVPFRRFFPESGLSAVKTARYYAVSAGKSGGLVKVFPEGGDLSLQDRGYTLTGPDLTPLSSFRLCSENTVSWSDEGRMEVMASFREGSYFFPHPLARLLLKVVSRLPGGYLLVKKGVDFIRRRKNASLQLTAVSGRASSRTLTRTIIFQEESVKILDEISGRDEGDTIRAAIEVEIKTDGLISARPAAGESARLGEILNGSGGAKVEKEITPRSGRVEVTTSISET
jgi:hypothetical protein